MSLSTHLLGLATAAALAGLAPPAGACTPARAGPSVASQPEPWRRAVAELLAASATSGDLWSCSGGVVDLVARDGGATLIVVSDDGHEVSREVTTPDEVVPLGEALLARPIPMAVPDTRPETPGVVADAPPRALISVLLAPRYAGSSNVVWGGLTAAASLPFLGLWGAGAWLRYDGPTARFEPGRGPMTEFCFGASAGRTFPFKRLELRTSLLGSVAVVTRSFAEMDGHRGDKMGKDSRTGADSKPDQTRVDGRFGAEVRLAIPITKWLRGVVAFDAELAPRELARQEPPDTGFLAYPSFTLGLGVGMELALR